MSGGSIEPSGVWVNDVRATDLSLFIGNDEGDSLAYWLAPAKDVNRPKITYEKWNRDHQKVIGNTRRGPGSAGAEVTFGFTTVTGTANEYAIRSKLADENIAWQEGALDLENDIPMLMHQVELVDVETRFVDAIDDTSAHDGGDNAVTLSGTDQWSDYDNSNPLTDIETGRQEILEDCGKYPNRAVMSPAVWSKLQYHPRLLEALKYTGTTRASIEQLQSITGIPEIRIGMMQKNTAGYGATDAISYIWGKDFYMFYVAPSVGRFTITAGLHLQRGLVGKEVRGLKRAVQQLRNGTNFLNWWRILYTGTFNPVAMDEGTSYMIKDAVA
jgi:hypothetical protein